MFFLSLYQSEIFSRVILMDATEKPTQEFLWSAQRLVAVVNWGEKFTKPSVKTLEKKKKKLDCVCVVTGLVNWPYVVLFIWHCKLFVQLISGPK